MAAAFALQVVTVRLGERRQARRQGVSLPWPRVWGLVAVAAIGILIAGGWLPQRRLDARARQLAAEAARPRTWPSRAVEGYVFGLTTRYVGDSIPYTLTVRCPSHRDCPPRLRLAVRLRGSTAYPSDVVPLGSFVPQGPTRAYHARRSIAGGDWFGRREYLQTEDWDLSFITPE